MNKLAILDKKLIRLCRKVSEPLGRLALFVIFFWFGLLKVIGTSPAIGLVEELFNSTFLAGLSFSFFIVAFGIYEMVIGLVFLFPKLERLAIALLLPHMVMTVLPIFILPDLAWQGFLTPTLEGQYII